jgi:hypothetical protein
MVSFLPRSLQASSNKDVSAFPDGENLFEWVGTIKGSTGTAYEGLVYKARRCANLGGWAVVGPRQCLLGGMAAGSTVATTAWCAGFARAYSFLCFGSGPSPLLAVCLLSS